MRRCLRRQRCAETLQRAPVQGHGKGSVMGLFLRCNGHSTSQARRWVRLQCTPSDACIIANAQVAVLPAWRAYVEAARILRSQAKAARMPHPARACAMPTSLPACFPSLMLPLHGRGHPRLHSQRVPPSCPWQRCCAPCCTVPFQLTWLTGVNFTPVLHMRWRVNIPYLCVKLARQNTRGHDYC